jgi:hypothetical protein
MGNIARLSDLNKKFIQKKEAGTKNEKTVPYHYMYTSESVKQADYILKYVLRLVNVKTAFDVGCGIGRWVKALHDNGVEDVECLDGEWFNPKLLSKYVNLNCFHVHSLNDGVYRTSRKYDLALCLEVAEHVKPQNADNVVETLTNMSDVILWSAAIPKQGGDGHVNEQWPSYWQNKFKERGYEFLDVIRPYIWTKEDIFEWYRQNIFLVVKKEQKAEIWKKYLALGVENTMLDVVHPKYWRSTTPP